MDFSILLPTRGRVPLLERTLQSIAQTAHNPEKIEVVLYLDEDDGPSHQVDHPDLCLRRLIEPRQSMGAMNNACYRASSGRYIFLANDDLVFRTQGWDAVVRSCFASYRDEIALIWGNDLFRYMPTHPFMSRVFCELIDGIGPVGYKKVYIDVHLHDIFVKLARKGHERRQFLSQLIIEHMHLEAGKASADDTSVKILSQQEDDERLYIAWDEERECQAWELATFIQSRAEMTARQAA